MRRTPVFRAAVAAVAVTALLAACGESEGVSSGPKERTYTEGMIGANDSGEPTKGGTLEWAAFSEPRSLDPAVIIAASTTGGVEMAAIFDTLLRYDPEAEDFVPKLAESLEGNDEGTEWTLKLREGVKFSDGTDLDAEAVKWSQERYATNKGPEAALWAGNVTDIEVVDPLTITYKLNKPWFLFPSILSTGPGMIVAKSSDKGGEFKPVGAGAFALDKWAPQEAVTLKARSDYWDGAPNVEAFKILYLSDQQTGIDSMKKGDIDSVLVRDPDLVDELLDADVPGYMNVIAMSNVALVNATEGHPGADERVRKALAMGIDPDLIRERAYEGHGLAGSTMWLDYSRWNTDTDGPAYDPDEAKKLLDEAKADGYDGKISYLDASDPGSRNTALAVKANLEAIGFEVTLDLKRTVAEQIDSIAVNRDYDVAAWGLSYREGDPFSKLFSTLHSSGTQTYGMPTSPEMDAAIEEFQQAGDESAQLAAMDKIQQVSNDTVPYLNWGPMPEMTFWNDNVHGIVPASTSMFFVEDAWIS
ncbi:ABC transporter substrate-binding protein [Nocardioides alcanivorans]|uniref:ABC transporter substrate-binding protein n=1 Tax=Nocardioides alcanivorans TaxID=2897352 RepID=UPI001F1DC56D|nr:ABC transporter substrate-binding protein [Nocardioides alcanivorans]